MAVITGVQYIAQVDTILFVCILFINICLLLLTIYILFILFICSGNMIYTSAQESNVSKIILSSFGESIDEHIIIRSLRPRLCMGRFMKEKKNG